MHSLLLLLCLTGLPLIFHEEIEQLTGTTKGVEHDANARPKPLDEMVATAKNRFPGKVVKLVVWDKENPGMVNISVGDTL